MLIGGPNQSHKVNFKELLPFMGKIAKRSFAFCFVNTFPEFFWKSFLKERTISYHPFATSRRLLHRVALREAGTCKGFFLIQDISKIKTVTSFCALIINYLQNYYASLFLVYVKPQRKIRELVRPRLICILIINTFNLARIFSGSIFAAKLPAKNPPVKAVFSFRFVIVERLTRLPHMEE